MASEPIQVLTTVDSEATAERISSVLVERRLAACVQVTGPITSRYRWQGEVETATEWQCLAKTESHLFGQVEATIDELHPYDEPEIVAVPILAGSPGYLAWLADNVE